MGGRFTHIGVVGYGYWGSKHVRVLTGVPDLDVTVVESNDQRRHEAKASFPAVRTVARLDDVLDRLDAVVVATPPATHARVAMKALRAGVHTMVEKPLTTSVEEAEALVETARASGALLMVGHTFEYNAAVWKLKEIIQSGELGRVLYLDCTRLSLGRYQQDCNVIWDLAPHDISIVAYLLDEIPSVVSVWAQRNVGHLHADVAYLRLEFDKASTAAFVHVSWLNPQKVRRVTVVGEKKMAVYDDMSDNERIRIYDVGVDPADQDAQSAHAMPVTYRSGDIVSPYIPFVEPLLVQDTHFVECVRTGETPHTPGERGLDVVRVLTASDVAATTAAPTDVPRRTLDVPAVNGGRSNIDVA